MSKKAKTEVDEKSAVIITDAVLAENQAKLDSYEKSIKAVQERRRKVIIDSKLYTYDKLSELYGGAQGQALLDAVTAEHTLIGKLTTSGMSYADIEGLVDSPAVNVSGDNSSADDDADNGFDDADDSLDDAGSDEADGQTSFFDEKNPYAV